MFRRLRHAALSVALVAAFPLPSPAQEPVDTAAIQRIRQEAFERSRVMELAQQLTDVYGPRLTGSPMARAGAEWALGQLRSWGITGGRLESWGPFGRGWTNERMTAHVVAPSPFPVIAYATAWTPGTNGPVTADVVLATMDSVADFAKYRGRLRGKLVMLATPREVPAGWVPTARRWTDEQLREMQDAPLPEPPRPAAGVPQGPGGNFQQAQAFTRERTAFLQAEGIAALLSPSGLRGDVGTVAVQGAGGSRDPAAPAPFPIAVLAIEHYGRIVRLLQQEAPVRMELDIRNTFHDADLNSFNLVAEIPGTDRADEVVMLGAHFDTWHGATGATDNTSGSAVMLEAMRILKALNLPMRRTVRLALWTGEEQGLLGARAYVRDHLADRTTGARLPAHAKVSAYYNMDNGTGAFRGVYLQANAAVRPIFEAWMAPFRDKGVTTTTLRNTGSTDHVAFDEVGIPGFQFIQDPVEYSTRTHHSSMDSFERLQAEDLKLNAAVVAAFVYHTANRAELLPRKAPLTP